MKRQFRHTRRGYPPTCCCGGIHRSATAFYRIHPRLKKPWYSAKADKNSTLDSPQLGNKGAKDFCVDIVDFLLAQRPVGGFVAQRKNDPALPCGDLFPAVFLIEFHGIQDPPSHTKSHRADLLKLDGRFYAQADVAHD